MLCEVIYLLFLQDEDVGVDRNDSFCHRRRQRWWQRVCHRDKRGEIKKTAAAIIPDKAEQ